MLSGRDGHSVGDGSDTGYGVALLEEKAESVRRWWLLAGEECRPYRQNESLVTHEAYILFYRRRGA